jgi:hypothetical protein
MIKENKIHGNAPSVSCFRSEVLYHQYRKCTRSFIYEKVLNKSGRKLCVKSWSLFTESRRKFCRKLSLLVLTQKLHTGHVVNIYLSFPEFSHDLRTDKNKKKRPSLGRTPATLLTHLSRTQATLLTHLSHSIAALQPLFLRTSATPLPHPHLLFFRTAAGPLPHPSHSSYAPQPLLCRIPGVFLCT